jgi:hypothetical protein
MTGFSVLITMRCIIQLSQFAKWILRDSIIRLWATIISDPRSRWKKNFPGSDMRLLFHAWNDLGHLIDRASWYIGVLRSRRNFGDYGNFGACFVPPILIVIRFIETSGLPMYLKYLWSPRYSQVARRSDRISSRKRPRSGYIAGIYSPFVNYNATARSKYKRGIYLETCQLLIADESWREGEKCSKSTRASLTSDSNRSFARDFISG